jgi:hypothetical protein
MLSNLLLYCDKVDEEDLTTSGSRDHERDEEDQGDGGNESSEDLEESVEDAEQSNLKFLQAIIQFFQHVISLASEVINIAGIAVNAYTTTYYDKQPYHTSILTGVSWVNKLLNGHPERIQCELSVHHHIFIILFQLLHNGGIDNSKHVTLEEQLAIFLYACVTGISVCHLAERFQCSNNTISKCVPPLLPLAMHTNFIPFRYFKRILITFSSHPIYSTYVRLPDADTPIPPQIVEMTKLYPYFANVIGTIDSTHINFHPSAADHDATHDRKGNFTQNCLAACNFNMRFMYMLSGFQRSTADAHVYNVAHLTNFTIPPGKAYLVDAGFGACNELFMPYCGVHYHLAEWGCANQVYVAVS